MTYTFLFIQILHHKEKMTHCHSNEISKYLIEVIHLLIFELRNIQFSTARRIHILLNKRIRKIILKFFVNHKYSIANT